MTQGQQPEALRLANALAYCDSSVASQAAAELRRLHAENAAIQQGYDAARMEIEGLRDRVQELGAMLRENCNRRIVELEAQLEAIGAGGVETLRRRECLHQIEEPDGPLEMPPVTPEQFSMDIAELMGAPAAQGDAEDAAMFTAQHQFLEWNREQGADRPIFGSVEYAVFQKAIDLYRAARSQAKEGGAS